MSDPNGGAWSRTRPDRTDVVVIATALGAIALYTWLGFGLTFFSDEWGIIVDRQMSAADFVTPFNEHWLGITIVVYRSLLELFGMTSYVPFMAVLTALHVIVALEIYVLARRRTYPALAVGVAIIVLLFGSGFENLFWGAQMAFVGAMALGLGALVLVDDLPRPPDRTRATLALVLLLLAIMTSGYGLFLLVLVGLDIVLDPRRWRLLAVPLIPGLVYVAWYLAIGRAGVATVTDPFTAASVLAVPEFVWKGAAQAFAAATGTGPEAGRWLVFALAAGVAIGWIRGGQMPRRALACFLAIIAQYVLLGLVRAQLEGVDASQYSRYTYFSGMIALLGIVSLIGTWRPATERGRLAGFGAIAAIGTLALLWNLQLLVAGHTLWVERAELTRAFLLLAMTDPLPAGVPAERSLIRVPAPVEVRTLAARYGSPLEDVLVPWAVRPVSPEAQAEALRAALDPPDWLLAREASEEAP